MKLSFLLLWRKAERFVDKTFESLIKWSLIAVAVSVVVGLIAAGFNFLLSECASLREKYPLILLSLPLCGLAVTAVYHILGLRFDKGTNMVIMAVRDGEKMTWKNTLSIFFGTVFTHFGGGSAGREGAALQIGGSVGSQIGLLLKFDKQDHRIITMCGMSAGFAALFGTPAAAALFSMEVISVGIMHYSAIVPCVIAAITGLKVSSFFGVKAMSVSVILESTNFTVYLRTALLAALCGLLSILFCYMLKMSGKAFGHFFKNQYIKTASGGVIVAALTFIIGTYDYNGAGSDAIMRAFVTPAGAEEFILKMIFTAITLGCGYKGGEILPAFFAGSAFGSFFAPLIGLDCSFGAAVGLCCLFCGVTNCPITAVILSMELFGAEHFIFYLLACSIAYVVSGYAGLYSEQKIVYSKFEPKYIDKKVGRK